MVSKVKKDLSEAHFDTIPCFLSYAISIWHSHVANHMALPYGRAIWSSHMAMPYTRAIWECHIASQHAAGTLFGVWAWFFWSIFKEKNMGKKHKKSKTNWPDFGPFLIKHRCFGLRDPSRSLRRGRFAGVPLINTPKSFFSTQKRPFFIFNLPSQHRKIVIFSRTGFFLRKNNLFSTSIIILCHLSL